MKHNSYNNKPINYLIIGGLFFLVLSPNIFYLVVGKEISSFYKQIGFFCFSFSLISFPFFIFHKKIRLYFILLLPFALLAPTDIFYLYLYKYPLHIGTLGAILETNTQEAKEFIYGYKAIVIVTVTLIGMYMSLYIYLIKKIRFQINTTIAALITILSLSYLCMTFFLIYNAGKGIPITNIERWERFQIRVKKSYPSGIILNLVQYFREMQYINNHQNLIGHIPIHAAKKSVINENEVYVLIIGETARYDHFSIHHYNRDTSPLLRSIHGLISYTDVCTSATDTRMSVPLLLTRANPLTFHQFYNEPSFISFFKKAGFETHWISNFKKISKYDTSTSVLAEESDHILYVNSTGHWEDEDENSKYKLDEELLPILRNVLSKRKTNKLFIVLHTKGSHYRYDLRVPPQFDIFKPTMKSLTEVKFSDPATKDIKINSYDNSILYTDYFIASVIKIISSYSHSKAIGAVFYISDHGEDLFDDDKNLFGHGNREVTKYVAHVPLFVWFTNSYKIKYAGKSEAVFKNRFQKISAGNLFYSILDMADIKHEGEDLTKSIFSNTLKAYPRYIITTDYKVLDCDAIE
jgi:glucan phosphoethanolaminetransferase (alkaline phosphatase superfamily)